MPTSAHEPSGPSLWVFTGAVFVTIVAATIASIVILPSLDEARHQGIARSLRSLAAEQMALDVLNRQGSLTRPFYDAEMQNIAEHRRDLEAEQ